MFGLTFLNEKIVVAGFEPATIDSDASILTVWSFSTLRQVVILLPGFANHMKSRLQQWGPWRALDERYGYDIHPCVSEASLKALQTCLGLWLVVLGLQTVLLQGITHLQLPTCPHRLPPYTCYPWYYSGCEKVAQNPALSASNHRWSWTKTLL